MSMVEPLLTFHNIKKAFHGVYALKGVSFQIDPGQCVALVGENGAGKSTLMKILSGVWPSGSFEGEYCFRGQAVHLSSPVEAWKLGIAIIHQELCLYPELTVMENLFLGEAAPYSGKPSRGLFRLVDWSLIRKKATKLMQGLEFSVPIEEKVSALSVAQQQLVEIARAFHQQAEILILDEPTSALSQAETEQLYRVIERLKGKMSFVYISHKLDEVFRLSDKIVILRDGMSVAELPTDSTDEDEVIRHMVGRPIDRQLQPKPRSFGSENETVFQVQDLSHRTLDGKKVLSEVSFKLRQGEILGICGLMGAGRSELLRSILGVLPGERSGEIFFQGKSVHWRGIRSALKDGAVFLTEDRKQDGLFVDHSISFNLTISTLSDYLTKTKTLDRLSEAGRAHELADRMSVKRASLDLPVKFLSGGNQQKVLFGRILACNPKLLLIDEPTRGIDIGAKEEIYAMLRELAEQGLSLLLVSSELPEVLSLSDRVLVLNEGRLAALLPNQNLTQETLMYYAAGRK